MAGGGDSGSGGAAAVDVVIWFVSLFDPWPVLNQEQIDKLLPNA